MCFLIFYYFQITPTCSLIAGLCLLAVTDIMNMNTSVVFTAVRKSEQESQFVTKRMSEHGYTGQLCFAFLFLIAFIFWKQ